MPSPKHPARPWDAAAAGLATYSVVFLIQWVSCLGTVYQIPFRGALASAWAWHLNHSRFVAQLQAAHLAALVPEAWCFSTISIAVGFFVAHGVLNPKPPTPRNRHA